MIAKPQGCRAPDLVLVRIDLTLTQILLCISAPLQISEMQTSSWWTIAVMWLSYFPYFPNEFKHGVNIGYHKAIQLWRSVLSRKWGGYQT